MNIFPSMSPSVRTILGAPLLLVAASQMGGMCGPGEPGPCSSDRFNCDDGSGLEFTYRDDCAPIATPLGIEIGTGYGDFQTVSEGSQPPLERGSQGGQHAVLAYRVVGADLTQSDRLRLTFRLSHKNSDGCSNEAGAEVSNDASGDIGSGREACEQDIGTRTMIRGGRRYALKPGVDGVITETGIIVILDWWGGARYPFRVRATVEDLCGRRAEAVQDFDPYNVGW